MTWIGDARKLKEAGDYGEAADLFLREAHHEFAEHGLREWSFGGVEGIGYALQATYCSTRAGEERLAETAANTAVDAIRSLRRDLLGELDEYPKDNRCLLAYLFEWEGDAHLYRGRPRAKRLYRAADAWFDWIVENYRDEHPAYTCGGWGAETGSGWAYGPFEDFSRWQGWGEVTGGPYGAAERLAFKRDRAETFLRER